MKDLDDPSCDTLPRTIRGRFWLFEHPEIVLSGELVISAPHNFDLHVAVPHYALNAPGYWEFLIGKNVSIILGTDEEGRPLTCADCVPYATSASYKAPRAVVWHELNVAVHRCFIGAHISDVCAVKIHRFSSFFTGFSQWASDYDHDLFPPEGETESGFNKRVDVVAGVGQLRIWRAGNSRSHVADVSRRTETRYWRPSFEPAPPITIDQMLDMIRQFQELLCLLEGRPVGFNDVRTKIAGASVASTTAELSEIEFMVMMPGYKSSFPSLGYTEPLVPLRLIQDCWPTVLSAWFKAHDKFAAPFNLYFAVVFAGQLFDEQKFLFLAYALEGYHRCKFKTNISYLDRLQELFDTVLKPMSYFISNRVEFLENTRDLRNELTHPGLGKIEITAANFFQMWRRLKAMFEICVLADLGVTETALARIGRECSEWA